MMGATTEFAARTPTPRLTPPPPRPPTKLPCRPRLPARCVCRANRNCITAAEWHPAGAYFVTSDNASIVRVWAVGNVRPGDPPGRALPAATPSAAYVHHCNVTAFAFGPAGDHIFSCSSDGVVHRFALELAPSAAQQERLEEGVTARDEVLNMNPER